METTNTPYLPNELIIEILLRLPVKSLIRFKCVCKLWFSLISDHHFANSRFQLTEATHTHILFLTETPKSIALDSLFNDHFALTSFNPNFSLPESDFNLRIKGSCRGFIFLLSSSNIYLWNPSTGVHKQIPLPPNYSFSNSYGFGYDRSTDDYLVVSLSFDNIPNSDDEVSRLGIFSLRANAWKEILGPTHLPFCSDVSSYGHPVVESFFNGAIHWLAYCFDVIVAFHLMERQLLEIPVPNDIQYHDNKHCGLWVFRGFLSLWGMVREDKVDIWVMKEYKVQSSWTKTLVLTMDTDIPYVFPICCTKSGDVVGINRRTGLVRYGDEGEFLEHNYYFQEARGFQFAMYTESLLSLPNDSAQA